MKKFVKKAVSILMAAVIMVSAGFVYSDSLTQEVSAVTSTGVGLSEHCMTAYYEDWAYVYGAMSYGAVDCSGLIMLYNGVGGIRFDLMAMSPETGYVSSYLPNIHGLGLWQPGHVGVYVGSGMAVDARSSYDGMCYQSVYSKSWTCWFKVYGVSYPDTGWVTFNGNSFYYENGEYLVNTSRTIDGITYTFNTAGTVAYAVDEFGASVDTSGMSGNNATYDDAYSSGNSYGGSYYPSYDYDAEAEAEAEAERLRQEEEERQRQEEEERLRLEEEERKKREEEERIAAENRLAEEKKVSAIAYLAAAESEAAYNHVEPETVAIPANAELLELKEEPQEVVVSQEPVESQTTVVMDKAMNSTMGDLQTMEVQTNRHPLMFVAILVVTLAAAFAFVVAERKVSAHRYAKAAHSRYRR